METKLLQDFERARTRGVPLIAIEAIDPATAMRQIVNNYKKEYPIIKWDVAQGFSALSEKGQEELNKIKAPMSSDPPYEFIKVGLNFGVGTIFIVLNGHRFMEGYSTDNIAFTQAVWNLRDKYRAVGQQRMFVSIQPQAHLPEEIRQDFIILEDPLPDEKQIWEQTKSLYEKTGVKLPDDQEKDRIIQTLKGLSGFAIEQADALSLTKSGMDMVRLWAQKKKQVEQTTGLSIYQGTETFDDVKGADSLINFYRMFMKGKKAPTVPVFIDEIEKMFAGIQGDLSGTSQEQHGEFLRWMQDNRIPGIMQVGHPGTGKSHVSKALAGENKLPMLELNISALKGSLVGQTGEQTRAAFKQILSIGRPLVVATSNSLGILPPELKRRFKLGTWFFDLPTRIEKDLVWNLYQKKYHLSEQTRPDDTGWTQSEIEVCCDMASEDWLNTTLLKASKFVVPISKSDPEKIKSLRMVAHRRFNSVSKEGVYEYEKFDWMEQEEKDRSIDLGTFDPQKVGQA
jgi:hypothetical protein